MKSGKPKCKLTGKDGNVFNIIALVSRALSHADQHEAAREWREKAMRCTSYAAVVCLANEYVEVR